MSEAFLRSCVGQQDVRPGLQFRREAQRQHQLERRRQEADQRRRADNRPRHQLETEQRERALDQPIDSTNKGFAMLQMMGYKPGMAIGKQGDGRTEPIRPEVKQGRGGLGREAALEGRPTAQAGNPGPRRRTPRARHQRRRVPAASAGQNGGPARDSGPDEEPAGVRGAGRQAGRGGAGRPVVSGRPG